MKTYLKDLIARIGDRSYEKSGCETISFNAFREIEKLTDQNVLPLLYEIVEDESDTSSKVNAYCVIGKLASLIADHKPLVFLINRLTAETDNFVLISLLETISYLKKSPEIDLRNIFIFLDAKSNKLRYSAIRALKQCQSSECEDKLISVLKNTTDHFDLYYACITLSTSGSLKCLSILKELLCHSSEDVSIMALNGIIALTKKEELLLQIEHLNRRKK